MDLTALLPPPNPSTITHVQITILSAGSEYIAYVTTNEGAFPISIHLHLDGIKKLNKLFQEAIQQLIGSFGKGDAYEIALAHLARTGNYAFNSIFSEPSARRIIRTALHESTFVQIVSKDFFLPWELLYDASLGENAANYWGMRYIISRFIIQDKREGAFRADTSDSKRPKIGLISYDQSSSGGMQDILALKRFHKKKQIHLLSLHPLSINRRSTELAEFWHFLSQEMHVLHFSCYAYEQDPIEKSYLLLPKNFPISILDFVVGGCTLEYSPFVILNTGPTSIIDPLHISLWAKKLWEIGAQGVLATDFPIPEWLIVAFNNELYQHMLAGMTIGETLLTIRRNLWQEQHTPLGLAYALYSSPSITFARG